MPNASAETVRGGYHRAHGYAPNGWKGRIESDAGFLLTQPRGWPTIRASSSPRLARRCWPHDIDRKASRLIPELWHCKAVSKQGAALRVTGLYGLAPYKNKS